MRAPLWRCWVGVWVEGGRRVEGEDGAEAHHQDVVQQSANNVEAGVVAAEQVQVLAPARPVPSPQ